MMYIMARRVTVKLLVRSRIRLMSTHTNKYEKNHHPNNNQQHVRSYNVSIRLFGGSFVRQDAAATRRSRTGIRIT